jgi:hypothetical protein
MTCLWPVPACGLAARREGSVVAGSPLWAWAITVGLVVALLAADFVLAARRPHVVGLAEAWAPRVFRTAKLMLFHAASCPFRYSSWASCGVR